MAAYGVVAEKKLSIGTFFKQPYMRSKTKNNLNVDVKGIVAFLEQVKGL